LALPRINLVSDGDSITFGLGASIGMDWPSQVGRALNGLVRNYAVSSSSLADLESRAHAVDLAVQLVAAKSACLLWAGTNDIELYDADPETLYRRYLAYLSKRQGLVVAFTILTRPASRNPAFEAKRQAFNGLLRRDADALVDLDSVPLVDGVHPTDEGQTMIARAVVNLLRSMML
jgi:lysophospholipase L1-like esterase